CSGFTHGCASASYLFDSNGKRVSALVLPRTHKANIREQLSSASVELLDGGAGRLWAQSGWGGGDRQHIVYFSLGPTQKPLCEVSGQIEEKAPPLSKSHASYLKLTGSACSKVATAPPRDG